MEEGVNIAAVLGAAERPAGERFTIYLPDRDRAGATVADIGDWIDAAMALLTDINGGATRLAPTEGRWLSPEGQVVKEETTLVYSYYPDPARFYARLPEVADFLHLFGRETNQGEVVAELFGESEDGFFNRFYSITAFEDAPAAS